MREIHFRFNVENALCFLAALFLYVQNYDTWVWAVAVVMGVVYGVLGGVGSRPSHRTTHSG